MSDFLLGLKWQGEEIKIASLKKTGKKYELFSLDNLSVPFEDKEKSQEIISSFLRSKFPPHSQFKAVLTIPESLIFLKELTLPKIKNKKISDLVFWEATSVAPILPEEAVISWKKISETEKNITLAVMVARDTVVENYYDILTESGVTVTAIEPTSISFSRITNTSLDKNTLLVLVEESETDSIVLRNSLPVFSTSVSSTLQARKDERWKLTEDSTEELAASVKKIISYWEERENQKILQVVLAGEGVKYTGLATSINKFAQVPTNWVRTKEYPAVETGSQSKLAFSRYLIPFSAVLRLVETEDKNGINLLPKKITEAEVKEKKQSETLQIVNLFTIINSIALILLLSALIFLKFWGGNIDRDINQTRLFVANHPAQKYTSEITRANGTIELVNKLIASQKDTGERLRKISTLTPEGITFETLSLDTKENDTWIIKGLGDRTTILAFYEQVKRKGEAKEVYMPFSNLEKEIENEFELTIVW